MGTGPSEVSPSVPVLSDADSLPFIACDCSPPSQRQHKQEASSTAATTLTSGFAKRDLRSLPSWLTGTCQVLNFPGVVYTQGNPRMRQLSHGSRGLESQPQTRVEERPRVEFAVGWRRSRERSTYSRSVAGMSCCVFATELSAPSQSGIDVHPANILIIVAF